MNGSIRINRFGIFIISFILITLFYYYHSSSDDKTVTYAAMLRNPNIINLRKLLIASIQSAQRGGMEILNVSKNLNVHQKSKGKTKEGVDDPVTDADSKSHCVMKAGLQRIFPNLEVISEEDKGIHDCSDEIANFDLDSTVLHENAVIIDEYVLSKDVTVWIDPLDATKEFTEKLYEYVTTMVCVAINGKPIIGVIHNPFSGQTTWGWVDRAVSEDIENIQRKEEIPEEPIITVSRSHPGDVKELSKSVFGEKSKILIAAGSGYKVLQVVFNNATAYLHSTRIKKWDICAGNAILNALGGKMTNLQNEDINYASESSPVNDKGLLAALSNHYNYINKFIKYQSDKTQN